MSFNHEKRVKAFIKSNGISYAHHEELFSYPNSDIYVKVCKIRKDKLVTERDQEKFRKFCRYWIDAKGEVNPQALHRISRKLEFYLQKRRNANAMLARKSKHLK